jgi:hypothetical protein
MGDSGGKQLIRILQSWILNLKNLVETSVSAFSCALEKNNGVLTALYVL